MRSARPTPIARALAAWLLPLAALSLAGCGLFRKSPSDNDPTLATLAGRTVDVAPDGGLHTDEKQAIEAYRKFLEVAPRAPQREIAMRRLGDLEMDRADRALAEGTADKPDYQAAIARYRAYLAAYPKNANNDRVLYQLSRAHEQGGELETALKTLDRLVAEYPATPMLAEAQFRRGELLFSTRQYAQAEAAYAKVLAAGDSPFDERALYMQGWSRFKQGKLEESLPPFFGVLDGKLGEDRELTRADQELVEDTLRVTSITLANLQGPASIPPLVTSDARRRYEPQVYEQLGELYLKQERVKDAADTFGAFARAHPLHAQAPVMLSRVIDTYEKNGFGSLALDAKKDFVERYGVASEFRRANPEGWEEAQPLVKAHLTELALTHHAQAQKTKSRTDVAEAIRWYRLWLQSFPDDKATPGNHFLLAELLTEDGQHAVAATEYERVAYGYPKHDKSAEAGYAALVAYAAQKNETEPFQRSFIASSLRFADTFGDDVRAGSVLTNAADRLFALKDGSHAAAVAQRALNTKTLTDAERRTDWTVIAHTAFDGQDWAAAEQAYARALALTPEKAAGRADLVERQAAAVYQQGEAARSAGRTRDAVAAFERVAQVAPNSPVRATAQYDAAAALIGLSDWDGAARLLEDFRQRFPSHPLQKDVPAKLATVYLAQQRWTAAAGELDRVAAQATDRELARTAQWQAAELLDKANDPGTAKAYERYLRRYPQPLEAAMLALSRVAQRATGPAATALLKELVATEAAGGTARTPRTQALAAQATLTLAEPVLEAYRKVPLVEPLARQLKLKKAKMEDVLRAYNAAADYGVAEAVTAATFQTAALYQDFGKAMLASQRPKGLKKAELEQYNVLLEEQAFPFEEKAIELHEGNAHRAAGGVYDDWVKKSYDALAQMKPGRWGRSERTDAAIPLNQQAIELRRQGRFTEAQAAYEQAISANGQAATPVLNLAILHDLYLNQPVQALALYERYLALAAPADNTVSKWVAELRTRKPAAASAAPAPTPPAAVASRKDAP